MTLPIPTTPEDPLVVAVVRQFKSDLMAQELAQSALMTRKWLEIEDRLSLAIDALAQELDAMALAGRRLPTGKVMELQKMKALLAQVRTELNQYGVWAEELIARRQLEWGLLGQEMASDSIRAVYWQYGQDVSRFNVLPVYKIEQLTAMAGDGSPLASLLKPLGTEAVAGIFQALEEALLMGWNPRKTAEAIRNGMGMGLTRALNIARTEQLRAVREASRLQYQTSGVVRAYQRIATHDSRVCPACILAEGAFYKLGQTFEEHPQGRCSLLPVVRGLPPSDWLKGPSWFQQQPEAYQSFILGPGRFNLWKSGDISLQDVVKRKEDEIWGNSLIPRPKKELIQPPDQRTWQPLSLAFSLDALGS